MNFLGCSPIKKAKLPFPYSCTIKVGIWLGHLPQPVSTEQKGDRLTRAVGSPCGATRSRSLLRAP